MKSSTIKAVDDWINSMNEKELHIFLKYWERLAATTLVQGEIDLSAWMISKAEDRLFYPKQKEKPNN